MATPDEIEAAAHADPDMADLLAALNRSAAAAAAVAAACLTADDLTADLPAIREEVARDLRRRLHGRTAARPCGIARGRRDDRADRRHPWTRRGERWYNRKVASSTG